MHVLGFHNLNQADAIDENDAMWVNLRQILLIPCIPFIAGPCNLI